MRVHRNCCGLDVPKKIIATCLIREDSEGNSVTAKRLCGSMTRDLHELAQWLCAAQVTAVAMEATGVYWMPVWNVLEQYGLQLLLINPEHYKAVPGEEDRPEGRNAHSRTPAGGPSGRQLCAPGGHPGSSIRQNPCLT